MALTRYGTLIGGNVVRQSGSDLTYLDSGLVEGSIVYACTEDDWSTAVALLGTAHPDDSNVWLYRLRKMSGTNAVIFAAFECIGLSQDPTDRVVSYPASVNTDPIETHPNFVSDLAGTLEDPLNGATFDPDTREFLGWLEDDAPAELRGVRSYYTGSVVCRATYFTRTPPRFSSICKIVPNLPNIPDISGVKDWLYMPPSAEQIGNVSLWRVTEEFLGSGPAGWSQQIYG